MFNYNHIKTFTSLFIAMLLLLLSSFIFLHSKEFDSDNQHAVLGKLDLSQYDFTNSSHSLDGEWKFYESILVKDKSQIPNTNILLSVPDYWNHKPTKDKLIPAKTFGTYHLKLKLNSEISNYGIKIPDISSAYTMYINDKLVSQSGKVGTSYISETPNLKNSVNIFTITDPNIDIFIQVSNFQHSKGGLWDPIIISTPENITKIRTLELTKTAFLSGLLCFIMIYNFQLFIMRYFEMNHFLLAVIALVCIIRITLTREIIIQDIVPNFPYIIQLKLEYASVILLFLLVALLIFRLFKGAFPKEFMVFSTMLAVSYLIVIFIFPVYVYSDLLNFVIINFILIGIYTTFIMIKEALSQNIDAIFILIGFTAITFTAINDLLYINKISTNYKTAHFFVFGVLILMLCLFHIMNIKIVNAFEDAEKKTNFKIALLQSQITPHFLHNSINTVIYLVDTDPNKAKKLLFEFSTFLRAKFKFETYNKNKTIPLNQELNIIKSYITLQNARFENRIHVHYNIDSKCLFMNIPPLLIQPLVENSVQYSNSSKDIIIIIKAEIRKNNLVMRIEDNGPGIPKFVIENLTKRTQNIDQKSGLGIYATHNRLKMMYGKGLNFIPKDDNGTIIQMCIPIEREELI